MSKAEHTPGPWHVEPNSWRVLDQHGRTVVSALNCSMSIDIPESEANTRLIAAAPTMEKALQGVLHHNDAIKEQYKLPASLIRQIEEALNG